MIRGPGADTGLGAVSAEAILDRPAWQGGFSCASDTCWETPARKEEHPGFSGLGEVNHPRRPAQAGPGGGGVLPAEAAACSLASVSPFVKGSPRAALGMFLSARLYFWEEAVTAYIRGRVGHREWGSQELM